MVVVGVVAKEKVRLEWEPSISDRASASPEQTLNISRTVLSTQLADTTPALSGLIPWDQSSNSSSLIVAAHLQIQIFSAPLGPVVV